MDLYLFFTWIFFLRVEGSPKNAMVDGDPALFSNLIYFMCGFPKGVVLIL